MQLTLYSAMKGYLGGCALRDKYGNEYLRKIAASGGKTTIERYGREHMKKLSALAVAAKKRKRDNDPHTVKYWDGSTRRIVPYKKTSSRAKKPILVQILLGDDEGVI